MFEEEYEKICREEIDKPVMRFITILLIIIGLLILLNYSIEKGHIRKLTDCFPAFVLNYAGKSIDLQERI